MAEATWSNRPHDHCLRYHQLPGGAGLHPEVRGIHSLSTNTPCISRLQMPALCTQCFWLLRVTGPSTAGVHSTHCQGQLLGCQEQGPGVCDTHSRCCQSACRTSPPSAPHLQSPPRTTPRPCRCRRALGACSWAALQRAGRVEGGRRVKRRGGNSPTGAGCVSRALQVRQLAACSVSTCCWQASDKRLVR